MTTAEHELVERVETALRIAMIASCNCEHEASISPKPEAHDLSCRYRILYEAADKLADARHTIESLLADKARLETAAIAFLERFDGGGRADTDYVAGLMRAALTRSEP